RPNSRPANEPHRRTQEKSAPSTAATASNNPHHDPILGQQPRPQRRTPTKPTPPTPATATGTTHTTASNHAHNLEHPYDPRHQQQPRPHAGNTPATQQPAPIQWRKTPRRSRTGDARQGGADRSRDHPTLDHQARPQPRIPTKPTPSTTTTASTTTHTTASSHAHIVEHHRSPRHQQR